MVCSTAVLLYMCNKQSLKCLLTLFAPDKLHSCAPELQKSSWELAFLAICSQQQLLTSHVPCHFPDHSNPGAKELFIASNSPWKTFNNFKTLIHFRIQIFNTTDDYQFSRITTIIILWGFHPEKRIQMTRRCLKLSENIFWMSGILTE